MRILLVTYWYLPHIGGVNTYINVLRNELIKNGHEVDVLAHSDETNHIVYMLTTGQYVQKSNIKNSIFDKMYNYFERSLPYVDPWIRWREIERYAFELSVSLFDLNQYDIIHTQDIISTRALARVKPAHVPLVSTIHGLLATEHVFSGDITSKSSLAWNYVLAEEFYGATSADKTIVPTYWLKKMLSSERIGVPEDGLTTIPYGMDINQFLKRYNSPTYGYIPIVNKKTILICPARMVPVKGHRYLLEALAKLKRKRKNFVCWLVGGGPLLQEMKSISYQLNIQDVVHFLGDRNDVPQLLKQSDILVLPSLQDNHPFTIMEAQVGGKLVVASDAGGIPEMVKDGFTGFIFKRKNSDELAEKLNRILSNSELRRTVAYQGMQWGHKRWSPRTLLNSTLGIYQQAISTQNWKGVFSKVWELNQIN